MSLKTTCVLAAVLLLAACGGAVEQDATPPEENATVAEMNSNDASILEDRFARLALDCVHREFPNKIAHVMTSEGDVGRPRDLTPAFYGCFDWHSSVHGHWLLTRILTTAPQSSLHSEIRTALSVSFTAENLAAELAYYTGEDRGSFERPYGIAWYLQLVSELHESEDAQMQEWRGVLKPLEDAIVLQIKDWLPKLYYPVRLGTHNQTAFAFGLMLDYARTVGDTELETLLVEKSLAFHRGDVNCPMAYEPSGEDFLSPCLMEADLMRRVMDKDTFSAWLTGFLPDIPKNGSSDWLEPGVVLDASDGKLVHLDGVNLSRAWALEGIAAALEEDDPRVAALQASADRHREAGVAAVSAEHYSGSHWLASFATYLTTKRGITGAGAPQ